MEVKNMSGNRSNRVEVPEAKAAMDRFKTEVASELGVNLKEGYNGDLTSREAGSIGGEMVRRMIKKQEELMKYKFCVKELNKDTRYDNCCTGYFLYDAPVILKHSESPDFKSCKPECLQHFFIILLQN